jgi:hypothetical protein
LKSLFEGIHGYPSLTIKLESYIILSITASFSSINYHDVDASAKVLLNVEGVTMTPVIAPPQIGSVGPYVNIIDPCGTTPTEIGTKVEIKVAGDWLGPFEFKFESDIGGRTTTECLVIKSPVYIFSSTISIRLRSSVDEISNVICKCCVTV